MREEWEEAGWVGGRRAVMEKGEIGPGGGWGGSKCEGGLSVEG